MEESILAEICAIRQSGGQAVLVTVIDTRGSTPRKAGSKMLVYPDGRIVGTIGGGCAESEVKLKALSALDDNTNQTFRISMLNDTAADEGMVCGGTMDVFIQVIYAQNTMKVYK